MICVCDNMVDEMTIDVMRRDKTTIGEMTIDNITIDETNTD